MLVGSRLDDSHPHNSVVTVRRSQRYPDTDTTLVSNLDLSMNGVWLSAKTAVQSSNRLPSWIVFAAAPSLENRLGSELHFDPSGGKLSWDKTLYEQRADIIATPVPLCFQPGKAPPRFLPGSWIESPQSQIKYGTASEYKLWAENACYAEMTVHSCFFTASFASSVFIAPSSNTSLPNTNPANAACGFRGRGSRANSCETRHSGRKEWAVGRWLPVWLLRRPL